MLEIKSKSNGAGGGTPVGGQASHKTGGLGGRKEDYKHLKKSEFVSVLNSLQRWNTKSTITQKLKMVQK